AQAPATRRPAPHRPARPRQAMDEMTVTADLAAGMAAEVRASLADDVAAATAPAVDTAAGAGAPDTVPAPVSAEAEAGRPLGDRDTGLRPEDAVGFDRESLRPEDVTLDAVRPAAARPHRN